MARNATPRATEHDEPRPEPGLQERLDRAFGYPQVYDPMDGYKACRIYCARPEGGDITDIAKQAQAKRWLLDTFERFRPAVLQTRAQIEAEVAGGL